MEWDEMSGVEWRDAMGLDGMQRSAMQCNGRRKRRKVAQIGDWDQIADPNAVCRAASAAGGQRARSV